MNTLIPNQLLINLSKSRTGTRFISILKRPFLSDHYYRNKEAFFGNKFFTDPVGHKYVYTMDSNKNGYNSDRKRDIEMLKEGLMQKMDQLEPGLLESLVDTFETVLFDCDGVLWLENDPLPHAAALVLKLRELGKRVFFVTNNSTKTRPEFLIKLNKLGFEATVDEVVNSSYLTALYLSQQKLNGKVYVIGTLGVVDELEEFGIECLPIGPDPSPESLEAIGKLEFSTNVGAVVVGFDQYFNYTKLTKAATYLENPNVHFVATNTDERFPTSGRLIVPGTGAIVNSVKTAAEREPVVMGKPSPAMFEFIAMKYNLAPEKTLMVGDRGNTDILFGRNCKLWTLLVLTGVTTLKEAQHWQKEGTPEQKDCLPHFYLDQIGDLYDLISTFHK